LRNIRIVFVGSGNVAWHLSQALENAGLPVVAVYSRRLMNARELAARLYDATATDSLDFSQREANLFFSACRMMCWSPPLNTSGFLRRLRWCIPPEASL
jgi:glutamyl-tRNA reductase